VGAFCNSRFVWHSAQPKLLPEIQSSRGRSRIAVDLEVPMER
jgi:hypothetical protein